MKTKKMTMGELLAKIDRAIATQHKRHIDLITATNPQSKMAWQAAHTAEAILTDVREAINGEPYYLDILGD